MSKPTPINMTIEIKLEPIDGTWWFVASNTKTGEPLVVDQATNYRTAGKAIGEAIEKRIRMERERSMVEGVMVAARQTPSAGDVA